MPSGRYIAWVGTSLLALLFVADWYLPKSLPEPARDAMDKPVIRIWETPEYHHRLPWRISAITSLLRGQVTHFYFKELQYLEVASAQPQQLWIIAP
jgi:hypothetical protein